MPVLDPLLLPEPVLPVLGVVGDVGVAGEVLELPLAPLPADDLLKWASHSARDTWPSLFASTDEKLGADVLEALPDIPPLDDEDEVSALPPDAAGDDVDLSLLVLDEELCATATLDSANSAAAVAALNTFSLSM